MKFEFLWTIRFVHCKIEEKTSWVKDASMKVMEKPK
jgi:hypothetical protein